MYNRSYKLAFTFAIVLHVVIISFLLIRFTTTSRIAMQSANTFINATAINEYAIDNHASKFNTTRIKPSYVPLLPTSNNKKLSTKTKEKVKQVLQKNLMLEQAKEIAELKKEKQAYRKDMAKKQQQQMQDLLQKQVLVERQQLANELSQEQGDKYEAHSSQSQGEIDIYKAKIIQAISSQWIYPEGVDENASCQLLINLAPDGAVLNVQLLSSSGNPILDRSAQAAVLKASPLPIPTDQWLFNNFRIIKFKFNPRGVIGN